MNSIHPKDLPINPIKPKLNSRYLCYCKSNDNTPEKQMLEDLFKYPGGIMTGFILWNGKQWGEFYKEMKLDPKGIYSHIGELYDVWLDKKFSL